MSAPPNDGSMDLGRALVVTVMSAALTLVSIFFAKRGSLGLAQGGAVGYLWLLFLSTFMLQAVRKEVHDCPRHTLPLHRPRPRCPHAPHSHATL